MRRLEKIEMFRAGIMNDGREVDAAFIDTLVDGTTKAMKEGFVPKVKIGSNHESTVIRGTIDKIYRIGESLFGDIAVAEEIYDAIQAGEIPGDRSIETGSRFYLSDGIALPAVLTGLVIGIDVPANHTLDPIFERLEKQSSRDWNFEYFSRYDLNSLSGDTFCARLDAAIALALQAHIPDSEFSALKRHLSVVRETFERREKVLRDSESTLAKLRTQLDQREAADHERYADELIGNGSILPASRENVLTMYRSLSAALGAEKARKLLSETFHRAKGLHTARSLPVVETAAAEASGAIDPTNHIGGKD